MTTRIPWAALAVKVAVIGLFMFPRTASDATIPALDERVQKLETFFESYNCPRPYHIPDYLAAADTHGIDYRVLPAISLLESTCGSYQRLNNRWGWDSKSGFPSISEGIDFITGKLAEGEYYRNKTLEEKLMVYNPKPVYARYVRYLMREIENSPPSSASE